MKRAAELLRDGATVGQAAWLVGYSQPAQFAKAFRLEHGHLPRDARRRDRAGLPPQNLVRAQTVGDA